MLEFIGQECKLDCINNKKHSRKTNRTDPWLRFTTDCKMPQKITKILNNIQTFSVYCLRSTQTWANICKLQRKKTADRRIYCNDWARTFIKEIFTFSLRRCPSFTISPSSIMSDFRITIESDRQIPKVFLCPWTLTTLCALQINGKISKISKISNWFARSNVTPRHSMSFSI